MLVSWNWLKDYVPLAMSPDELAQRLAMAGLNHESTERAGDDWCIDLEVTSNRPDWLGHLGIAREVSVLWQQPLKIPRAQPAEGQTPVGKLASVSIEALNLCSRYTARVVKGVKMGSSPAWLANRLATIGIKSINNVVDVTNYVMMECGQPLHAFDLARLTGPQIIVRQARPQEKFVAIDHRTYELTPEMCVIADARTAVALGGVMGGAESEVSSSTRDLLIESAQFDPLSIRSTARALNLHSPSSYRFERGTDPEGVDWASRRCCELILELAGGELAAGVLDVGRPAELRKPIVLRLAQLERILGIEIPAEQVRQILRDLGLHERHVNAGQLELEPPSWRQDLTREVDLIEEVGRIYGYDNIPEDVGVPMAPSHRRREDEVLNRVRLILVAAGFDEAMTASVVQREWATAFSPWTDAEPLVCNTPLLQGADRLRRSLVPSLLEARRLNQSVGNAVAELFEIARIYLPVSGTLPQEQMTLTITSGGDFYRVKGVLEALRDSLHIGEPLSWATADIRSLHPQKATRVELDGELLGFVGEISPQLAKQFGLRGTTIVAEVNLQPFFDRARLVPQYREQSAFPSISQDVNLIVDEAVRWGELERVVWRAGGDWLESVQYQDTYRDPAKDGAGKKRLLLSFVLRAKDRTLTGDEANAIRDRIVAACGRECGATLLR